MHAPVTGDIFDGFVNGCAEYFGITNDDEDDDDDTRVENAGISCISFLFQSTMAGKSTSK